MNNFTLSQLAAASLKVQGTATGHCGSDIHQQTALHTAALPEPSASTLTMSTLEIAKLTGKRHDNVMADAKKMLEELGHGVALSFQGYYIASNGKRNPLFNLPKDLTLTLVAGYSIPMRHP